MDVVAPLQMFLSLETAKNSKKTIDKSIDFLRGWEEKMVSIFCLRSCEEVDLSLGPNGDWSEIHN